MSQRLPINLTGISRNKPDGISADGSLQEMIGMRPKDGAWRVVGAKDQNRTVAYGYRYEFLHQISSTRRGWWLTNSSGSAIAYRLENEGDGIINTDLTFDTYSGTQDEVSFAALGNVVIMIDHNDEVLQAYLFEADTDTYRLVGDLLPDLLPARITNTADGVGPTIQLPLSDWNAVGTAAALITEIASQRETGYWINRLYFRYAYELFDGSIVKHSQPIRIDGGTFDDWVWDGSTYWETNFNKYIANFQAMSSAAISTLQSDYPGIIKSVNIYVCRPKEEVLTAESGSPRDIVHTDPTLDEITGFYLIKKIALEELTTSVVNIFDSEDISDLVLRNSLPVDNLTSHTLYSQDSFSYNQRLFWSKIKNTLFSGFSPSLCNSYPYPGDAATGYDQLSLYCEVTIDTNNGQKVVVSPTSGFYYHQNQRGYLACFAYPDSRASKLKIIVRNHIAGTYRYINAEYSLKPHKFYNFAFVEDVAWDDTTVTTLSSEVKTYWDYNRIQATEIMNPFYFPTINSYRVGHGQVVGLSTNAIAISTGQFGEYPVYVFTTDGIWSLQIGNETVLIQSIKPLSRHVCNNKDSILAIDGGSTFSTDKGLFIISGEKIVEISKEVEGGYYSIIRYNSDYTTLLAATGANNLVCANKFLTYLSGANIGYDFINNEIIVSNSSRGYSWVFNLDNGWWYKIGQVWNYFINEFPKMWGINLSNSDVEDLTDEVTTGNQIIHIETRPMSFGIIGLKKMIRSLLEVYMVIASGNTLQVQIFGSADGVSYNLVYHHDTISSSTLQRLLIGRTIYSCEYFILVISSSSVDYDGHIKRIVTDVSSKFDSKLRKDM